MYNLLVAGCEDTWDGPPLTLDVGRCVHEYTNDDLVKRYGQLESKSIAELKRLPCIFAYETPSKKAPLFGLLRDVTRRAKGMRIEYEILSIAKFITASDLGELSFDLDIEKNELFRTHWALKDVRLAKELSVKGIILPPWARSLEKVVDITKHNFQVALSFPGEIREFVESIASELERIFGPDSYFYDNNYFAQLAQPSLDTLLQDVYRNRSKLIVVFLSGDYQRKEWCGIEFRAIKEMLMEKLNSKIMLIKMDDGKVDGVYKTDGYLDGRKFSSIEIAQAIRERVEIENSRSK